MDHCSKAQRSRTAEAVEGDREHSENADMSARQKSDGGGQNQPSFSPAAAASHTDTSVRGRRENRADRRDCDMVLMNAQVPSIFIGQHDQDNSGFQDLQQNDNDKSGVIGRHPDEVGEDKVEEIETEEEKKDEGGIPVDTTVFTNIHPEPAAVGMVTGRQPSLETKNEGVIGRHPDEVGEDKGEEIETEEEKKDEGGIPVDTTVFTNIHPVPAAVGMVTGRQPSLETKNEDILPLLVPTAPVKDAVGGTQTSSMPAPLVPQAGGLPGFTDRDTEAPGDTNKEPSRMAIGANTDDTVDDAQTSVLLTGSEVLDQSEQEQEQQEAADGAVGGMPDGQNLGKQSSSPEAFHDGPKKIDHGQSSTSCETIRDGTVPWSDPAVDVSLSPQTLDATLSQSPDATSCEPTREDLVPCNDLAVDTGATVGDLSISEVLTGSEALDQHEQEQEQDQEEEEVRAVYSVPDVRDTDDTVEASPIRSEELVQREQEQEQLVEEAAVQDTDDTVEASPIRSEELVQREQEQEQLVEEAAVQDVGRMSLSPQTLDESLSQSASRNVTSCEPIRDDPVPRNNLAVDATVEGSPIGETLTVREELENQIEQQQEPVEETARVVESIPAVQEPFDNQFDIAPSGIVDEGEIELDRGRPDSNPALEDHIDRLLGLLENIHIMLEERPQDRDEEGAVGGDIVDGDVEDRDEMLKVEDDVCKDCEKYHFPPAILSAIDSLLKEYAKLYQERLCQICYEKRKKIVSFPCCHQKYCLSCLKKTTTTCSTLECKKTIQNWHRMERLKAPQFHQRYCDDCSTDLNIECPGCRTQIEKGIDVVRRSVTESKAVDDKTEGHISTIKEYLQSQGINLEHCPGIMRLIEFYRQLLTEATCVMCASEVAVLFIPCCHMVCCEKCAETTVTCPLCHLPIQSQHRIFH